MKIRFPAARLAPLKLIVATAWFVAASVLAQKPATDSPASVPMDVFGVGFTNVTDTSARLVFTTTHPATAQISAEASGSLAVKTSDDKPAEIHAVVLSGLERDRSYTVRITCRDESGTSATASAELVPHQRPASGHRWPGYTIFSTSTSGDDPSLTGLLADSGVRMVRVEVSWDHLFPQRGVLNHDHLNQFVDRVRALRSIGIEPLVLLDYSVWWTKPDTNTTMTWRNRNFGPPDNLADWETYVRTVVSALRPFARYYEIWNEPDAGYLATGSFVERPNLPPPIGRPPFKDNPDYWIGDRYVPMIETVRKVMNDLEPQAILMNGGWNRDYTGQRGDIMLQRGAAPYLDDYAYHVYSHAPDSFARWFQEVDGGFRQNIDRIFAKNHVSLPLAVTEWGTPAWQHPPDGKGFATFADAQLFYLKTTFYFLSMERFEILSQFSLGLGPDTRDHDPLFFMLVNQDSSGKLLPTPAYATFRWLAHTFGSVPYQAIPVEVEGAAHVHAYAIRLQSNGAVYLAAWQDGDLQQDGHILAAPPVQVKAQMSTLSPGTYHATLLDHAGQRVSEQPLVVSSTQSVELPLPAATTEAESDILLMRIAPGVQ